MDLAQKELDSRRNVAQVQVQTQAELLKTIAQLRDAAEQRQYDLAVAQTEAGADKAKAAADVISAAIDHRSDMAAHHAGLAQATMQHRTEMAGHRASIINTATERDATKDTNDANVAVAKEETAQAKHAEAAAKAKPKPAAGKPK
jgi:hypothetical protein